ncbi:MAG: aldehyde ferredoxin oxidoreductase [Candidatus Eisenbacteria sp.]|nr:aldehyde ferredoxin oxidoreductase [Candidatus Eisenbacteria bacterium]
MPVENAFRVMIVDLGEGHGEVLEFGECDRLGGGSGLCAALYEAYGLPAEPAEHPGQPLIFAIGPLTGYFPLMSKVVCGFKSPYHEQYAESHAGGRLALALRFCDLDALVVRGVARHPSCLVIGSRRIDVADVHYLWGRDSLETGKLLRKIFPACPGHRSILRIGPAGERRVAYASINVDTFRHFGRLGAGAVMGSKLLKGIVVQGDLDLPLPEGKEYPRLYRSVYEQLTTTPMMSKYHDLGTAANLSVLNTRRMLPWRNLQQTHDPEIDGISGERFGDELLLRQTACAGCPVGCIHIGLLRERFADEHHFQYRQVSYDYEPIFAMGSMLGVASASAVLSLLYEVERQGLDVMSTGVALAWATEARDQGLIGDDETLVALSFGDAQAYLPAVRHLGSSTNAFYELLGRGTARAARQYGGEDFACVLGQEMAGYATGEVFYAAQSLGFRHSHLDSGGYAFDQKNSGQDAAAAVRFLIEDERERCLLTSMVACLFARDIYHRKLLAEALASIGQPSVARNLDAVAREVQRARWRLRRATGFRPEEISIPRRLTEVITDRGPIDTAYLDQVRSAYAVAIGGLAEERD